MSWNTNKLQNNIGMEKLGKITTMIIMEKIVRYREGKAFVIFSISITPEPGWGWLSAQNACSRGHRGGSPTILPEPVQWGLWRCLDHQNRLVFPLCQAQVDQSPCLLTHSLSPTSYPFSTLNLLYRLYEKEVCYDVNLTGKTVRWSVNLPPVFEAATRRILITLCLWCLVVDLWAYQICRLSVLFFNFSSSRCKDFVSVFLFLLYIYIFLWTG